MKRTVEKAKKEAIERMKILKLFKNVITDFKDDDRLNKSEDLGFLYWLYGEEEEMVKELEKEHECVVYHVILSRTNIGTMYSLLYVSLDDEEWEEDRADLQNGQVLAYVVNKAAPECSEIGYIGIKPQIGGLVRVA